MVLERDSHPEVAPRFNPDRSYTIDITGHGLRALRSVDAKPVSPIMDTEGAGDRRTIRSAM